MNEQDCEAQKLKLFVEVQAWGNGNNGNNNNAGNVLGDEEDDIAPRDGRQVPRGQGQQRQVNPIDFEIDDEDEADLDGVG